MPQQKIISFGEVLLRFSPDWQNNLSQFYIGGSEANVAAALARWGSDVSYISAMPDNLLSHELNKHLQNTGVHTNQMIYMGERIGTYYLNQGSDLQHDTVVYDRNFSSFSELKPGTIDWGRILEDVSWFHWSAISPALNNNIAAVCKEALQAAMKKGIIISTDLNYRSKLWQYGKQPIEIMPELVQYCNVVMGNIWSANKMLGTSLDEKLLCSGSKENYLFAAKQVSAEIINKFPLCKRAAFTFRFSNSAAHNLYYATHFHNGVMETSKQYETNKVIDRVGSGDSFMAGLIYAINANMTDKEIIEFATAAAYKKLFIKGDFNTAVKEEILQLIRNHEQ